MHINSQSPNYIWLSTSIFCNQENWNKLFNQAIRPFLRSNKPSIRRFQICANFSNGENIRLAILLPIGEQEEMKRKTTEYFKKFLSTFPKKNILTLDNDIHAPFPNFSIYYGLYDPLLDESLIDTVYKLQEDFSHILMYMLSEIEDNKSKLRLAFYLNLGIIKAFQDYIDGDVTQLVDFDKMNVFQQNDSINKLVEDNEDTILGIANEFFDPSDKNIDNNEWILEWINLCKREVLKMTNNNDEIQKKYNLLLALVVRHLALNKKKQMVLSHFVRYSVYHLFDKLDKPLINDKYTAIRLHKREVNRTKEICKKIDQNHIPNTENEIRLFVIARNESLRLPYFFNYYFNLGVDRIFMIDNNSTDNTPDIALSHKSVHLFKIQENYRSHWNWIEYFLETYGKNTWCMVADVDELFKFPFCESLTLNDLIKYLEINKYTALRSFLLDTYPETYIDEIQYKQGDDPLKYCNYFDSDFTVSSFTFFDKKRWESFVAKSYSGGVRYRVFGRLNDGNWFCNLTKIPLFKYTDKTYLAQGMHAINGAAFADIEGTIIHTKFLNDFIERVKEESVREEHYANASEYKIYNYHIAHHNSRMTFKNENSLKYQNTKQLIKLGIMIDTAQFDRFIKIGHCF